MRTFLPDSGAQPLVDYADDGHCDDGGPGSDYAACPLGTDCADCGKRGIVAFEYACNGSTTSTAVVASDECASRDAVDSVGRCYLSQWNISSRVPSVVGATLNADQGWACWEQFPAPPAPPPV